MASTNETPRAVELGLLIRRFRERTGLSQTALAAQIGRHPSEVSRWERGKRGLDEELLGTVLGALGVSRAERDEALTLYHNAADPNWLSSGVGRQLAVVREYEDAADSIVAVQPRLIPGPLQTREYAIAVMMAMGNTRAEATDGADFRMARAAKILSGSTRYTAFIAKDALTHPPCDGAVKLGLLHHLIKTANLPNITIRVVPTDTDRIEMAFGPFVLIESSRAGVVVHLEQLATSTTMTDSRYVRGYIEAAERLREKAMSPDRTSGLIREIAEQMECTG